MKSRVENSSEVIENLRRLIAEAENALSGDIGQKSEEALSAVRERLEDGLESLNGYYSHAKKRVVEGARATDETIRTHPYESLAIAVGVGVLLGALIRRQ
jgi:ElaB/YqjD/DUF883 family membrane-anchored ribosome-binding protein